MKKSILLLFAAFATLAASAHDFEVDGIYYNITSETDKTAEVTYKGAYAGEYNEYSGSITIPATVTHNGVAHNVTSIGSSAFLGCSSLTDIILPEGVTSIGGSAFNWCWSLTAINIPASVTSIGESAFSGCSSLTAITIPESVTSIGKSAFYGCSSLTTINIPEGVTSIGNYAFSDCGSLTAVTIPEGVTSIGSYAFEDCGSLTAVTIPEGVTSIGKSAFYGCRSLTAITIPEGVTSIGSYAFYGCRSLTAITIPEGVTSIGSYAFEDCSSLERVTINCASVGSWFSGLSSLKEIVLGESVTSIGNDAFSDCGSLTAVHISSLEVWCNIDFADSYANPLSSAKNLYLNGGLVTELTIPNSVIAIKNCAFSGCSSLTAITIPEGVTSIGNYAFSGCSSLTAITIPEGVTSIGNWAFDGCSSLTAVHISSLEVWCNIDFDSSYANPLSSAKNLYLNGDLVTELTIPNSVTAIKNYAFYNCSNLTAITLPESVTSIGKSAFYDCSSLESLHIGPNVDSYGSEAFAGCTAIKELTVMGNIMPEIPSENLTSITLYSPIPLETKEFAAKVYRNATLNIPEGSLTRYQNADVWKNFWYVNEFDPKKGKAVFLTINQADNGYVKQHLTEGTVCTFTIVAAEGWKIHSVTFNGEEVTAQLTEEGTFTTPALQADAVLNIAYEKTEDNTMVANTTARAIKVQGHRGTLRITGTTQGEAISVYTTDGTLAAQENAEDSDTEITLPTGQVYIVTVADKVVKIGM